MIKAISTQLNSTATTNRPAVYIHISHTHTMWL